MLAEDVKRARRWLFRNAQELHVNFFHPAPTLPVVAMGAGSDDICPDMLTAHVPWHDMVYGQTAFALPAVLAGIIVSAKNLPAGQLDVWTRPVNLVLQPDD